MNGLAMECDMLNSIVILFDLSFNEDFIKVNI